MRCIFCGSGNDRRTIGVRAEGRHRAAEQDKIDNLQFDFHKHI